MGVTSPCATRLTASTRSGAVVVSVCDSAAAATRMPGHHLVRDNVAVEYSGRDERTRGRIKAALEGLG